MRLGLILLLIPFFSLAKVEHSSPTGFKITIEKSVQVSQTQAYQQFLRINQWWHPDHTWFGDSNGLYIEAKVGDCFCEKLGDKQALHMQISYVDPNHEVRMTGGLGPLQMLGITGGMSWQFKAIDDHNSKIIFNYQVTGYMENGLAQLAPIVDQVQNIQLTRLQHLLNHGTVSAKQN